jgi:hypothetical protein
VCHHQDVYQLSRGGGADFVLAVAILVATALVPAASAQLNCPAPQSSSGNPCVTTSQYDNKRDGFNGLETQLTPSNVAGMQATHQVFFEVDDNSSTGGACLPPAQGNCSGQLLAAATSNPIMAQPLYVPGISVSNPQHYSNDPSCSPCDMLIGVTLNTTVFAWYADGPTPGS